MGKTRFLIPALLIGSGLLTGCAADDAPSAVNKNADSADWGDPNLYPELGGKYAENLTALSGTCTWDVAKGEALITGTVDAIQTILVGVRAVDGVFLVNGKQPCVTTASTPVAASIKGSAIKKLTIKAGTNDTAAQTVIIDYIGGLFASGTTTSAGVIIDLVTGTGDTVKVRGTTAADTFTYGQGSAAGIYSLNTGADKSVDVTMANVDALGIALAGGKDVFSAQGGTATGTGAAVSGTGMTINGGDGDDSLVGSDGNDTIGGGAGADTILGAAGTNFLSGNEGNDFFDQGASALGTDIVNCGTETLLVLAGEADTVSYAGRTDPVMVSVGARGAAGIAAAASTDGYHANDGAFAAGASTESDNVMFNCEVVVGGSGADLLADADNTGDQSNAVSGVTTNTGVYAHTITGGAGDDTIIGGLGVDVLNGGDGDDTFVEAYASATYTRNQLGVAPANSFVASGADVFNGGLGTDTVDYGARTAGVTVTMNGTAADDGDTAGPETDNVKSDVENCIGSGVADAITGNDSDNVITGALGADTLAGGKGNDTFYEGLVTSGGDTFAGGDGSDLVDYSARTVAVVVTMGQWAYDATNHIPDLATADPGANDGEASEADTVATDVENVAGAASGSRNNVIIGNASANEITCGAGNDTIFGLAGDDNIDGAGGTDVIDCGDGSDITFTTGTNCND